jgi:hypothetical protein
LGVSSFPGNRGLLKVVQPTQQPILININVTIIFILHFPFRILHSRSPAIVVLHR